MRERTRPPVHPGGILKRQYLEPLGLGISQVALALGVSRKTLSKLINERGAVTPDMALRLARAFDTTPELWLNLQHNYDLWHATRQSEAWCQGLVLVSTSSTGLTNICESHVDNPTVRNQIQGSETAY